MGAWIRKFLRSSFLVLSLVALVSGVGGSLISGVWVLVPRADIPSHGSYFKGAMWGLFWACVGLVPYWVFQNLMGDIFVSWARLKNKIWRIWSAVCWAGLSTWVITLGSLM